MAVHGLVGELDLKWMADAVCAKIKNYELYDDEKYSEIPPPGIACWTCPVRHVCLQTGYETRAAGIWGGTTEKQRQKMRIKRHRKTCAWCRSPLIDNNVMTKRATCVSCGASWRT